ncbi:MULTISPECIES: COX15/CtaA family protein [Vibrio]|uniref:Heme A synthase n=1 Tax=Vibrio casei TaxID=673372 RepID=A0A368LJ96_9VIBR|nr:MULTISPECIES: COX15/CtaA family protein [Vibrio]RCS70777.1 heme A synthase [Vibrio casei]SJN25156.1 Heme A synthase, cytochrome oxidase biogenesis protein Cox15-CtaA [Vibrio casei]HBV76833.1 heme A synthase [Vibrio sp.]
MKAASTLIWLVRISLALTLVVIVLGAYTRISDAGLGCPDWPGCFGHLTVPTQNHEIVRATTLFPQHDIEPHKAWLEMIHRYVAGTLGLLIAAILVLSFKVPNVSKVWPCVLSVVVIFQAALGMWTVTLKLMPIIVMLHLLGGFALLCLLLVFYLLMKPHSWLAAEATDHLGLDAKLNTRHGARWALSLHRAAWIGCGVLVVQIMLGGWTSSNYAALVCTSFPICNGNWWQSLNINGAFTIFQQPLLINNDSYEYGVLDYSSRMTIHIMHRIGAVFTAFTLLWLAYRVLVNKIHPVLNVAGMALIMQVFIQIGLGITNVMLQLPVILAVAHNLVAALLLLNVVFICVGLRLCLLEPLMRERCSSLLIHRRSSTYAVVRSKVASRKMSHIRE